MTVYCSAGVKIYTMPTDPSEQPLDEAIGAKLKAEIQENRLAVKQISDHLSEASKTLSDDANTALWDLIEDVSDEGLTIEQALDRYDPDSVEYDMLQGYARAVVLATEKLALQEKHKPYLINETVRFARDISGRFNWDRLVAYYNGRFNDPEHGKDDWDHGLMSNGIASTAIVTEVLAMAENNELGGQDYDRIEWFLNNMLGDLPEWEKRGFINATAIQFTGPTVEGLRDRRIQLKDALEEAVGVIHEYSALKAQFRDPSVASEDRAGFLTHIVSSLNVAKGYYGYASKKFELYELDPRYLDAVTRFSLDYGVKLTYDDAYPLTGEGFAQHLSALRKVSPEVATRAIVIEGFEKKADEIFAITEEELRKQLELCVPACFLRRVAFIITRDMSKELDSDDPNVGTIGQCKNEYDGKGDLTKSLIEVYLRPNIPETSRKPYINYVNGEFLSTSLHEVAHSMHANLDYSDMRGWLDLIKEDPVAVTWYVGRSREVSETRGLKEDFCETFALFVRDPFYLMARSQKRFDYMVNLVGKYMGDDQRQRFMSFMLAKIKDQAKEVAKVAEDLAENSEEA